MEQGREVENELRVLFVDVGGSEDIQDYEGEGIGSWRLSVHAQDLTCSPYLANATVTKDSPTKQVWEMQACSFGCGICYVPHRGTLLRIESPNC